jgi:hypothetical protein
MDETRPFRGPYFTLEYPENWIFEIIEDIPAFYDPQGGGVLQVASVRSVGDANADREMDRWIAKFDISEYVAYEKDGVECRSVETVYEGRFWLFHLMVKGSRILFVMYNADERPDDTSARRLSAMIGSICFVEE